MKNLHDLSLIILLYLMTVSLNEFLSFPQESPISQSHYSFLAAHPRTISSEKVKRLAPVAVSMMVDS
jgi:hypothetical protein